MLDISSLFASWPVIILVMTAGLVVPQGLDGLNVCADRPIPAATRTVQLCRDSHKRCSWFVRN